MSHATHIASQLNIRPEQVAATIELLDAGNTLPFIARYRKEATGGLDEEQIRQISELLDKLRALDERRADRPQVDRRAGQADARAAGSRSQAAETLTALEDLYQPYKPKRRTRASIAREKGLQGLADLILQQPQTSTPLDADRRAVPERAGAHASRRPGPGRAISSPRRSATMPRCAALTREKALQWGMLRSEKIEDAEDERSVYEIYYAFECGVDRLRPHQVLAINRGEAEKVLRVQRRGRRARLARRRSRPSSAPTGARRWRSSWSWPSTMPPSACCCRPSSGMCAAS